MFAAPKMNQETNNQKKLPQKITITRNHEGKLSKVEGLRRDQILIKKNDGTYCILIKRSKYICNLKFYIIPNNLFYSF